MNLSFGEYFRTLIEERSIAKTDVCRELNISRPYLYSVLADEKTLTSEKQFAAVQLLKLDDDSRNRFFDLAARDRGEVPADIVELLADAGTRREIRARYGFSSLPSDNIADSDSRKEPRPVKSTAKRLTVPCCYQGGKQRVSEEIVNAVFEKVPTINDDTQFFDICCGSGAYTIELLNRGVSPDRITMLDVSSWGAFWSCIGNGLFQMSIFDKYLDAVPQDKASVKEHMTFLSEQDALIDEPYKYVLLQACSFGGKQIWRNGSIWKNAFFRSYWEPTPTSVRKSPANPMQPGPETLRARIKSLIDAGRGLTCINEDVTVLFDIAIPDNSVIYIDPPYRGTTGYAFGFDLDSFVLSLKERTSAPVFVSEGMALSDDAIRLSFGGAKGGISGNKRGKHEEWLSRV